MCEGSSGTGPALFRFRTEEIAFIVADALRPKSQAPLLALQSTPAAVPIWQWITKLSERINQMGHLWLAGELELMNQFLLITICVGHSLMLAEMLNP